MVTPTNTFKYSKFMIGFYRYIFILTTIILLPHDSAADITEWFNEYNGSGNAINHLTGEEVNERSVFLELSLNHNNEVYVQVSWSRWDNDPLFQGSGSSGNRFKIDLMNDNYILNENDLIIEQIRGERLYRVELTKKEDVITGTAIAKIKDNPDDWIKATKLQFYTMLPPEGKENPDQSIINNWIMDEAEGTGNIHDRNHGYGISDRAMELSIHRRNNEELRVILDYKSLRNDPNISAFGSRLRYPGMVNRASKASESELELVQLTGNRMSTITLRKAGNKVVGELKTERIRVDGSTYRLVDADFELTGNVGSSDTDDH